MSINRDVRRLSAITLISTFFAIGLSLFPSTTFADIVSVQTSGVTQGGNSCVPLTAHSFTPYIYDGSLHSFAFNIPDSSYVALAGSVGQTPISFEHMSRKGTPDNLRVHVDIETTPVSGSLPLSVTLVSAKGQSICMSIILMNVGASATPVTPVPQTPSTPTTPTPITPATPSTPGEEGEEPAEETPGEATTTPPVEEGEDTIPFTWSGIQNRVVDLCMAGGAPRIWILLIAAYAVITVIAVFAQLPASQTYSPGQRTATILVPFVLLIAFWFFSEACRVLWAPVASLLIAIAGIVGIYWNDPRIGSYTKRVRGVFSGAESQKKLPMSNSKAIITPPPTKKPDSK